MTDEKKIEEQAPEQGEEKVEAVVLDENVLEQLLVGCIWDVLRRMHRVATKAITPDQATEEDDAIARHLARTLMGENPGFTSALPLVGPALVEELRKLPDYDDAREALRDREFDRRALDAALHRPQGRQTQLNDRRRDMAGCGSNCSAGCCKDFSSRAERLPNLLSVEVTGEIFAKAVRNMTLRAAQRAAGMMSDEEYEVAKSKLVRWLVNAFSGENPHYEADSEWHGNGGLADYLAETLDYHGHSPRQVITHAAALFADDADNLAREIVERGGLDTPAARQALAQVAGMWAQVFTGVPPEFA